MSSQRQGMGLLILLLVSFTAIAQNEISSTGIWQGPAHVQLLENSTPVPLLKDVRPMFVDIRSDGSLLGTLDDCDISGVATNPTPAGWDLSVLLTNCSDARFNTRFTGKLALGSNQAKLQLDALQAASPLKVQQQSITAMLHR